MVAFDIIMERSFTHIIDLEDINKLLAANIQESERNEFKRIKDLIESTGLDELTETDDFYPEMIQGIVDEHIKDEEIESRINDLQIMSAEQRQMDMDQYGEEVNNLYRQALHRRLGTRVYDEEREKAINELLDIYPYSYSAAKAASFYAMDMARRALRRSAARNSAITREERYYNVLLDIQNKISYIGVLESGVEAVSTTEHMLAWAYYRVGRMEDLKRMVKSLEENYSGSIYAIRDLGSNKISYVTCKDTIARIRRTTDIDY